MERERKAAANRIENELKPRNISETYPKTGTTEHGIPSDRNVPSKKEGNNENLTKQTGNDTKNTVAQKGNKLQTKTNEEKSQNSEKKLSVGDDFKKEVEKSVHKNNVNEKHHETEVKEKEVNKSNPHRKTIIKDQNGNIQNDTTKKPTTKAKTELNDLNGGDKDLKDSNGHQEDLNSYNSYDELVKYEESGKSTNKDQRRDSNSSQTTNKSKKADSTTPNSEPIRAPRKQKSKVEQTHVPEQSLAEHNAVKDALVTNVTKEDLTREVVNGTNSDISERLLKEDDDIAKESYDREHEAEMREIEILNTPPKPGKIDKKEM